MRVFFIICIITTTKHLSAADLVWLATAILTRMHPDRSGFSHEEILGKVEEIEPDHGFKAATIPTHITSHCVANKKPDPGKHRKLFMNADGTYRLYRPRDPYHPGRKDGKLLPDANRIPPKYREFLDWYQVKYAHSRPAIDEDPILALRGLGKEYLRQLGRGEKFLRDLREGWEERSRMLEPAKPVKRKKAI